MDNYVKELVGICGLPFNEVIDKCKILQIGTNIVYIANYKKIINYGSKNIDLKIKKDVLHIVGDKLTIKQMDKGEIIILGEIYSVSVGDYDKK